MDQSHVFSQACVCISELCQPWIVFSFSENFLTIGAGGKIFWKRDYCNINNEIVFRRLKVLFCLVVGISII